MVFAWFWNSAQEPVVKSCSLVPTARITSACSHSRFAAPVPVTPDNVLGILSLVFWALTITVSLKYVMFITPEMHYDLRRNTATNEVGGVVS